MKNAPGEGKDWRERGDYIGQCRLVFNILEQWDGKRWRCVPNALAPKERHGRSAPLHFGPDDTNNPYAGDEAFLPRR